MKTLNELYTNIDVIEYVRDFFKNQRQDGYDHSKNIPIQCLSYRATNGTKCAIGCLIDNSFYSEEFEGNRVLDAEMLPNKAIVEAIQKSIPNWEIDLILLDKLQTIHDRLPIDAWMNNFEILIRQEKGDW